MDDDEILHGKRGMYWSIDGEELSLVEWANLYELHDYRFQRWEQNERFSVSLVWTGIAGVEVVFEDRRPNIFEVHAFDESGDDPMWLDEFERRFPDLPEASLYFDEVVEWLEVATNES